MPRRKITREERDRAIKEADSILRLGKKWQRNTPNERRPNFEAAAATILRRTIGSRVVSGKKQPMQIKKDGLQHQHNEREARLLARTLKTGTLPPEVLHSFQTGRARKAAQPLRRDRGPDPDHLPDFELYMQDHVHNLGRPGHYDVRSQRFQGHMHAPHSVGNNALCQASCHRYRFLEEQKSCMSEPIRPLLFVFYLCDKKQ
jgi:hypothetical protein